MHAGDAGGAVPIPASGTRRPAAVIAALAIATAAALFLSQGRLVPTLLLAIAGVGLLILAKAPLRVLGAALLAAVMLLDSSGERPHFGLWTSPLQPAADLLYDNLHKHVGIEALRFSLLEVLTVAILAVAGARALRRARRGEAADDAGGSAASLTIALLASIVAVLAWEAWGLARGGDFRNSLWQLRPLLILALAALALAATLRFPRDLPLVAGVVLGIAAVKALVAAYVYFAFARHSAAEVQYVATHADSMLFVGALLVAFAAWYERRTRWTWLLVVSLWPLLLFAIAVNSRRLAYIELALSGATWWFMVPRARLKVTLARFGLLLVPAGLLYLAAGWHSSAGVFKGARIVRSIVDSYSDRSTRERDVENYNLYMNFKASPLVGSGFGHEYHQYTFGDDISGIFPQWKYIPHNSVLGLLAFTGIAGFTLLWLPLVVTVWLAFRAHARCRDAWERVAAIAVVTCVVSFAIQAYGDMGLNSSRCVFLLAAAMAVAGRLAVAVGAWPGAEEPGASPRRRAARSPVPPPR